MGRVRRFHITNGRKKEPYGLLGKGYDKLVSTNKP